MKKAKRILCALLAVTMALGMVGCKGGKKSAENGEANLVWVMQGPGNQTDSEMVWEKFNEELKTYDGLENTNVEFNIILGSDYRQKVMLMQTSEEKMDILGTYGLTYNDEVKDGNLMDITDLVDKYAPDIKNSMPQWVFDLTKVDGRLYSIANYQQMSEPMWGYMFDKVNADKYLDSDALKEEALSSNYLTKGTLDIFEDYMLKLKADGKLNHGIKANTVWVTKGYISLSGHPFYVEANDDKMVVKTFFDIPELEMYSKRSIEWFKKGLIRKDIASAEINNGHYDIQLSQWHKYAEFQKNANLADGEKVTIIQSQKDFYGPTASNAGGNALTATCEYPENALRLLNLIYSEKGKELYRTLTYGIEGTHYKKISDDRIETISYGTTADSKYGLNKWIVGNTANSFETQNDPDGWNDYVFNDWNENLIPSKLAGFNIDYSEFETEFMQVRDVMLQYRDRLCNGTCENYEATMKEAKEKIKLAGEEKVIAEIQKQVDAFINK